MISMRPSFDAYLDEYYGLSTDTKPTGVNVVNGSTFIEMDTSTKYIYDAGNKEWHVVKGGSGGGGVPSGDNGDNLKYGDPTLNWANVGHADRMVITDENETSDVVGVGEAGLMTVRDDNDDEDQSS